MRNFPSDRGTVVGLLKAFVGLSASVFTSLYVGVFAPDALSYLLFLALGPAALIAACSFFINHVPLPPPPSPPRDARYRAGGTKRRECLQDRSRFSIVYAIVAVLSVYQMACSVYEGSHALDDAARRLATAATLSLLSLLLLVPVASGGFFSAVPSEVGVAFLGGSDDEDDEVEGEEEGGDEDEERRQRGPLPLPPSTHRRHGEGCAGADEQERRADGVCRDGKIGASATSGGGGGYRPPPLLLAPGVEDGPGDGTSSSGGAPRAADRGAQQHDDSCSGSNDGLTAPLLPAASTSGPPATPPPPLLPPPRELTVSAAVARPEFWLLALQFGVGIGAGLTYLNNLGARERILLACARQPWLRQPSRRRLCCPPHPPCLVLHEAQKLLSGRPPAVRVLRPHPPMFIKYAEAVPPLALLPVADFALSTTHAFACQSRPPQASWCRPYAARPPPSSSSCRSSLSPTPPAAC